MDYVLGLAAIFAILSPVIYLYIRYRITRRKVLRLQNTLYKLQQRSISQAWTRRR